MSSSSEFRGSTRRSHSDAVWVTSSAPCSLEAFEFEWLLYHSFMCPGHIVDRPPLTETILAFMPSSDGRAVQQLSDGLLGVLIVD
eukprot:scaffold27038_cov131-Skeletonema_marinoi.AAC.1